jgi:hypothetical protein
VLPRGDIGVPSGGGGGSGHSRGLIDAKRSSLHPRPSVHGEEPYPTRCDPVTQNTADLKE